MMTRLTTGMTKISKNDILDKNGKKIQNYKKESNEKNDNKNDDNRLEKNAHYNDKENDDKNNARVISETV